MGNIFEFNKNLLTTQEERREMQGTISSLLTCKDARMILNAHCTCGKEFSYDLLNNKDKNVQKKFILLVTKVYNGYLLEVSPILYCKKCGAINVFNSFMKTLKIKECNKELEIDIAREVRATDYIDSDISIDRMDHLLVCCTNYIKEETQNGNWYIFDTAKECVDMIKEKLKDVKGEFSYGKKKVDSFCIVETEVTKKRGLKEFESLIKLDNDNFFVSKLFLFKKKCVMTNSLYHDALIVYDNTEDGKISISNLFTVFNLFNGKSKRIKESIIFNLNSGMTYLSIHNGNKSIIKNITYREKLILLTVESKEIIKYLNNKDFETTKYGNYHDKNAIFKDVLTLASSYKFDIDVNDDLEYFDKRRLAIDNLSSEIKNSIYNLIKKYKEEHFNIKFYKDPDNKTLKLSLFNRFGDAYLDYQKYINKINFFKEQPMDDMLIDEVMLEKIYTAKLIKKLKHNIPNTAKNLKDELYFKFKPNINQDEFVENLICNNLAPDRNLIKDCKSNSGIDVVCYAYVLLKQLLKVKTPKDEKILFKRIFKYLNNSSKSSFNCYGAFYIDYSKKNILMDSIRMFVKNKKYIRQKYKDFNFDIKNMSYTHSALVSIQIEYDIIHNNKIEKYSYSDEIKEKFNKVVGNIEFKLAENNLDLVRAGKIMNICVGSYNNKVKTGLCSIVVGYDTTSNFIDPVFCMEINEDFTEIAQFKGDRNSSFRIEKSLIKSEYNEFVNAFSYKSEQYAMEAIKYIANISNYVLIDNCDIYDLLHAYDPPRGRYAAKLKMNNKYIDITDICKEIQSNQLILKDQLSEQEKEVKEEDMRLYA